MSIAIGMICIFTIVTLRDEYLMRMKHREFLELQEHYRAHETTLLLQDPGQR